MRDVKVFVDTNVLLYIHDRRERIKGPKALEWMRHLTDAEVARTNLQVLNELSHVLLSKRWFDSPEAVYALIDEFAVFGDAALSWSETMRARALHLRYSYSWWDCLLLASAIELGCKYFLSEDLQDGQVIEGLTIVSPFAHSPDQILASR